MYLDQHTLPCLTSPYCLEEVLNYITIYHEQNNLPTVRDIQLNLWSTSFLSFYQIIMDDNFGSFLFLDRLTLGSSFITLTGAPKLLLVTGVRLPEKDTEDL